MRTCKYDDSYLRQDLKVPEEFPYKSELMEIFQAYGYCNERVAQQLSLASLRDPKLEVLYDDLLDTMDAAIHLKMTNTVIKFDTYTLTNPVSQSAILNALRNRILGQEGIFQMLENTGDPAVHTGNEYLRPMCEEIFDADVISPKDVVREIHKKRLVAAINFVFCAKQTARIFNEYSRRNGLLVATDQRGPERIFMENYLRIMGDSMKMPEQEKISGYIIAQYLYFALTKQLIAADGYIPTPIAGVINDIMSLFGYLKPMDDATPKQKLDRVKRFFKIDKSTGVYERMQ